MTGAVAASEAAQASKGALSSDDDAPLTANATAAACVCSRVRSAASVALTNFSAAPVSAASNTEACTGRDAPPGPPLAAAASSTAFATSE